MTCGVQLVLPVDAVAGLEVDRRTEVGLGYPQDSGQRARGGEHDQSAEWLLWPDKLSTPPSGKRVDSGLRLARHEEMDSYNQ